MMDITWNKSQLKDDSGRSLTQSLFLELGYNTQYAVFTMNDEDKEYNGKTYPSLKKYYMDIADPTEYQFAIKCLLGWTHWKRITENKALKPLVDAWREELEVMLRSEGILAISEQSENNFQAAKWMADHGWEKRQAGRPSKRDQKDEKEIQLRLEKDLQENVIRMKDYNIG